jgi:transcriptional regulator with XRE-family HTH domain
MDALPFCSLKLKSTKPISDQYPKEINTLGDHIRKRRLDLGLLQREVAEKIGVTKATIYHWERQRTQPEIRFIARIIEFLGYDPIPQPKSFSDGSSPAGAGEDPFGTYSLNSICKDGFDERLLPTFPAAPPRVR